MILFVAFLPGPLPGADFIYIDANIGHSSGGHSALKLDDEVYHFQYYPDGIFRLVRDTWEDFTFVYNIMDNRNMVIHKTGLKKTSHDILVQEFNSYYLIQQKHISNLIMLREDIRLLEAYLDNREYALPFYGYFTTDENDSSLDRLRSLAGLGALANKKYELYRILKKSRPTTIHLDNINSAEYPLHLSSYWSWHHNNILLKIKLIEAIETGAGLKPMSYFEANSAPGRASLSKENKLLLQKEVARLEKNIIALLAADHDSSPALAVNLARYLVLQKSVTENRLYILKCTSQYSSLITGDSSEDKQTAQALQKEVFAWYYGRLEQFFQNITDENWNKLEDAANRNYELTYLINRNVPLRLTFEKLLPEKRGDVILPPALDPAINPELLFSLREQEKGYFAALQKLYNYHLVRKNCSTELFERLNEIKDRHSELAEEFGSFTRKKMRFIPFYASRLWKKNMADVVTEKRDSYRIYKVKKMKEKENSLWVGLREGNTLTSTVYRYNNDDSFFVFFTDQTRAFRPLFGIANLAAGIFETTAGFFTLPFDKGDHLQKGIRGVFFSMPELFFFNIRKGSFQFLDSQEVKNYFDHYEPD